MGKTIQTVLTFAALWTAVFAASSSWLCPPTSSSAAFANIGLIAASGAFWLASLFTFVSALNLIYRIDAHTARKAEQGGPAKRGDLN